MIFNFFINGKNPKKIRYSLKNKKDGKKTQNSYKELNFIYYSHPIKTKDLSQSLNPRFTKQEERANAISHGIGAVFSIIALITMLSQAKEMGTNNHLLGAILFGIGMILLYFSSTLNHALPIGSKGKDFFHNFDQISIYFFIAGTFTPLCLIALDGVRKWGLLLGEWGLAIIGILFKSFRRTDFENGVKNFILISYAIMGSMMFFLIFPLSEIVTTSCIILLCIGCILYGAGVIAFKLERLKYAHLVRHLVVLGGSFIHFFAISHYILPLELI